MAAIDAAVARVLALKPRLGLFDDPYRRCAGPDPRPRRRAPGAPPPATPPPARSCSCRTATAPCRSPAPPGRIALIGPLADAAGRDARPLGRRRPRRRGGRASSPASRAALPRTRRSTTSPASRSRAATPRGIAAAVAAAARADHVILCLGEAAWMSGEAASRARIDLPGRQAALAAAVLATGKPVVVLLFSGRPIAMPEVFEQRRRRRRLLVPRQRGRPRRRRPPDRRRRPLRRPAGHLAARRRPDADRLLRPLRRPPREPGRQVHQQVPRPAEQPAVPLRPRPRLHQLHPRPTRRRRARRRASPSRPPSPTPAPAPAPRPSSCFIRDPVASVARPILELRRFAQRRARPRRKPRRSASSSTAATSPSPTPTSARSSSPATSRSTSASPPPPRPCAPPASLCAENPLSDLSSRAKSSNRRLGEVAERSKALPC